MSGERPEDLLGAVDLADELADLAHRVKTGTTVALFGSWGIGKTRIGELLEHQLRGHEPKLPYARFDASKGPPEELPMRFVRECGVKAGGSEEQITQRLQAERKLTRWVLNVRQLWLPFAIVGVYAVFVVIGLLIALAASAVSDVSFKDVVNDFLLVLIFAPAVLSALIAPAAKSLTEELTLKPEAVDYVGHYDKVLEEQKTERMIVFVDELDRLPPDKLVVALQALEAFFSSPRTVFIVAIDRQAVERALTTSLGESAPENVANDYYSAGSAYLDKLFKQQLTVPPLRSHALYEYARAKARGSDLLKRFEQDPLVLRVLIPPHVTSPRQVSRLLNSFELTYRLLARRAGELDGQPERPKSAPRLAEGVDKRIREIAKLVCLRCEFPRFAADLHVDPELPALVLAAWRDELKGRNIAPDRAGRAMAYAGGRLPVSRLPTEGDEGAEMPGEELGAELRQQRSRQLLRYLDETKGVDGPGRDLVHAQGMDSKLPQKLADELVSVSMSGDGDGLAELIEHIRDAARAEAEVEDRDEADAVRDAEAEVLHLLSRRARGRGEDESGKTIHVLLAAVPHCVASLDAPSAKRVFDRIKLYRDHAGVLDAGEQAALGSLKERFESPQAEADTAPA